MKFVVRADIHLQQSPPWSKQFAIVAKLCFFFHLLYYHEVTYLISNKRNPSFINLEIQSRFTETAYKRGVNRLASSSRNKNYKKKIYLGFGLSNLRTIEHSNYRTFGLLDLRTIGPSPK